MNRARLPAERRSVVHDFDIGGISGSVVVGLYDDGRPGEVFIHTPYSGSFTGSVLDALALQTSLLLQYGVPLREASEKLIGSRFEPMGVTGDPAHPMCTSLLDYIYGWLVRRFG